MKTVKELLEGLNKFTESADMRDIVSKKDEEIYDILKTEIERILEDIPLSELDQDDDFYTWTSATKFFSQKFKAIDDKLKTIDKEIAEEPDKQEEIEAFYNKQINQFLQEIDEKLADLRGELY